MISMPGDGAITGGSPIAVLLDKIVLATQHDGAQVNVIATMFRFRKSTTASAWPCVAFGSRWKPNTQSSRLLIVSPAGSADLSPRISSKNE
jgi:hypothetical protein